MKVCVIGMGYIGLPTAAMLARNGHQVLGVDVKRSVLDFIREHGAPREEPGLADLVKIVLADGSLALAAAPESADVFILCLPTPINADKTPDLSYVEKGMASILGVLEEGNMVILESTVPPGTTGGLVAKMVVAKGLQNVDLAFAPERVIPGNILDEIQNLDRVMGGLTPRASERARDLYSCFVKGRIHLTDATTAEFVKLVENTYRDVNIAFANELAGFAPELGINIWEAIEIANRHPRVNIHTPGPGVGGHCIAVDPYFIIDSVGAEKARFMTLAREINSSMPGEVVSRLENELGTLAGRKIAVLGIAYKGDVGDPRESPALEVIRLLKEQGARVSAHDPFVRQSELHIRLEGLDTALDGADAVLVTTNHSTFGDIDPEQAGRLAASRIIFDTKDIIDPGKWRDAGWKVLILGCGKNLSGP